MVAQLIREGAAEEGESHTDEARAIFDAIDVEQRGFLDMEQLKLVFSGLGEELTNKEADQMLEEAGAEHDGRITFEIFQEVMGG
jgi:Ca2+-binding EF-hand superfamily protein